MEKQEIISVLNDLIRINNDRIVGYEKAIKESKDTDVDLIAVFTKMVLKRGGNRNLIRKRRQEYKFF